MSAGCLDGSLGGKKGGEGGDDVDGPVACSTQSPCPDDQTCIGGLCVGEGSGASCVIDPTFNDGCQPNELCFEDPDSSWEEPTYSCWVMPYCPESGGCPTTQYGSVCNEQLVAGKDRICMIGLCTSAEEHCPPSNVCVSQAQGGLGFCSDGSVGSYCLIDDHCASNNCWLVFGEGICN